MKFTATEQLTDEQIASGKNPNTLIKTVLLNSGSSDTATASVEWKNVYNGNYDLTIEYSGDSNHYPKTITKTFVIDGYERPAYNGSTGNGGNTSGGGSNNGSTSGGGGGGSSSATPENPKPDTKDYGTVTYDPIKGMVSSNYGIVTSKLDKNLCEWVYDGASALIWGGNADTYWKLMYIDGSYAKGSKEGL